MNKKKYNRLTIEERIKIQTLLEEDKPKSYIAQKLKRARSTITREIKKFVRNKEDKYDAKLAQWCAEDDYLNKRNLVKIDQYPRLKIYVYRGLLSGWSPEQIGNRINRDYPLDETMRISYETIYAHIYNHRQAKLNKKLIKLLPYQKSQRKRPNAKTKKCTKIKDQISIEQRPKHIEKRSEIGHWEGDLIIGKGQKSAIGTLVERKSRYTIIVKIENRKSKTLVREFSKEFKALDQHLTKSLTYDNGSEMAMHKTLTEQTGINVFFAHPYSSWERGTNENTNGLIRRYFPKGTDFNKVSLKQLKQVQNKLNNRPRKVINYCTPKEVIFKNSV